MAFNPQRFSRVSLADNTGQLTLQDSTVVNAPAYYTYCSATDSVATVSAANYFASDFVLFDLKPKDVIMCVCSDANTFLQVVAVDSSAGTISTTAFTASGSVDTANIVDGAVTNAKVNAAAAIAFSKLATLASGNVLVGSAGGVPTSVAMSGDISIIASGATAIGANKVLSSMLSPLALKYAAVAITAAEFNGMYAAPKLLVAAGGANTLLVLDKVQLLMTYGAAAYASGGTTAIQYDSTANGAGVIASTTLANTTFQATASTGWNFNAGVVAETFSTCVNKGLYISNITGAFTTGDSNMVAHVWYKVIPTV
jgi:hypothetical protein